METREVTQITEADFGTLFKLKDTATEAYAVIYQGGEVADTFKLYGMKFSIDGIVSTDNERVVFQARDVAGMAAQITIPNRTVLEQAD